MTALKLRLAGLGMFVIAIAAHVYGQILPAGEDFVVRRLIGPNLNWIETIDLTDAVLTNLAALVTLIAFISLLRLRAWTRIWSSIALGLAIASALIPETQQPELPYAGTVGWTAIVLGIVFVAMLNSNRLRTLLRSR